MVKMEIVIYIYIYIGKEYVTPSITKGKLRGENNPYNFTLCKVWMMTFHSLIYFLFLLLYNCQLNMRFFQLKNTKNNFILSKNWIPISSPAPTP